MRRFHHLTIIALCLVTACGGGSGGSDSTTGSESGGGTTGGDGAGGDEGNNEFQISESDTAGQAHGDHPSQITATETHAAMRLFVVNPDTGPIQGIVIKMTGPNGAEYYTGETDSVGYAEVLVPAGQRYEMEYLSLGRRNTTASVEVPEGRNQDIRLTMRYRRIRPEPAEEQAHGFILSGILFDTNRARLQDSSTARLDRVVEYMEHHPNTRIRISGHTDNVGNPRQNQRLSEQRANAVRDYLVEHGVDGGRVEAVGLGDTQPVAPNDTEEGRRQNRRIEAEEITE